VTDEYYVARLALRTLPVPIFLSDAPPKWILPITSINEDRLLTELGLPHAERDQIEGLQSHQAAATTGEHEGLHLTVEQLSSCAIARLAANPPEEVGRMQRRTSGWLLRPFPLGLRFSGHNMSPLPAWLAGAQYVALNMSNNDLAVQLHFSLFKDFAGYTLKPPKMRATHHTIRDVEVEDGLDEDDYWPPPRERLHRTTIDILSLHNLPKGG